VTTESFKKVAEELEQNCASEDKLKEGCKERIEKLNVIKSVLLTSTSNASKLQSGWSVVAQRLNDHSQVCLDIASKASLIDMDLRDTGIDENNQRK